MDLEFYKAELPCHHKITVVVHYIAGKPESILCDWSLSVSMHKTLWGIYLSFIVHLLSCCFLWDPPCSCSLVRSIPRVFVEPFLALLLQSVDTSVVVDHKLHLIWDANRRAPWERLGILVINQNRDVWPYQQSSWWHHHGIWPLGRAWRRCQKELPGWLDPACSGNLLKWRLSITFKDLLDFVIALQMFYIT